MSVFFNFNSFRDEIFSSNFIFSKKIIGIDYGTKKIGIALSDDRRLVAFKKNILIGNWFNIQNVATALINECKKYNSNILIIGYPKKLNDSLSCNCKRILQIANLLNENEKNMAILLFDERFSTKATKSIFNTRLAKHTNNKKIIKTKNYDDSSSACIILNDALSMLRQ